jgi:hypothetical protein
MDRIILEEWRNSNEHVRYPFHDDATLVNGNGILIDEDLFYDARLYPIGADVGVYLSKIVVADNGITFFISDPSHGILASGGFDFDSVPDQIALADAYGRPAGILVSSAAKLGALSNVYGEGEVLFEQAQTEFAPTVVVPLPQIGVRGVLLDDGNIVAGDIYLVGTDGVVLSIEDGNIRVDVIGDPYALAKACEAEGIPLPAFCGLKTINGIPPDANGDFKLTIGGNEATDNILRVEMDNGRLTLKAVGERGFA